jgi:hypothetical protein
MIPRPPVTTTLAIGLLILAALFAPGCGPDQGQPARESISAPRKGGGMKSTAGEKLKTQATQSQGGKLRGEGGGL